MNYAQGLQATFPHKQIRKSGCYFLCLCKWAEILNKVDMSTEHIIEMYHYLISKGYMEEDCFVVNPVAALNSLVAVDTANTRRFTSVIRTQEAPPVDIYVVYLKNDKHGHFILSIDGEGWDPLPPDRKGALTYYVDSYRVIT